MKPSLSLQGRARDRPSWARASRDQYKPVAGRGEGWTTKEDGRKGEKKKRLEGNDDLKRCSRGRESRK